jgi:signal transduction histidine kinase
VKKTRTGPSVTELKLRGDVDRLRRELARLKAQNVAGDAPASAAEADLAAEAQLAEAADAIETAQQADRAETAARSAATGAAELEVLRGQVDELGRTKQRLSRLYFNQLDENRKRAERLQLILQIIGELNADLDLDRLMDRIAHTIQTSLGFRIVLIRVREPGTHMLKARAFAGLAPAAREALANDELLLDEFQSWLKDEFRVSRSYFISHKHPFSRQLPRGYVADLGRREEWEWHQEDALIVPLVGGSGEPVGYFSVDDPVDRLVPSREAIELLEIFGSHVIGAIENARLYRQLQSHTRQLEETSHRLQEMNALKSNFVSTISHELRTPLTAIRACVDTLMLARESGQTVAEEPMGRFLAIIDEESQRLSRLIESVLDLSRLDSGHLQWRKQSIDFAQVLAEAERLLRPAAEAGQVNLKVANGLADTHMDADRDQMRQLVLHLGSNAVKFTPVGGSVTLRVSGGERELTLEVEDTGIGIPAEEIDKIFERFYQVDSSLVRRYGGTGLGLAICRSIVEWHDGRITATSTPGKGSSFTVVLPRQSGARVVMRPGARPSGAVEDLLKLAVEMVAEVMNARVVSLMSVEAEGDLVIQAAMGLEDRVVRDARIRRGRGVAGWVAEHRRPVCVSRPDDATDAQSSGRLQYRTGTYVSVPLEGREGLLGVLNVTDPADDRPFQPDACTLLLDLAGRIAGAWEKGRDADGSDSAAEDTASALRRLVEHVKRSRDSSPERAQLAEAIARALGLGESEIGTTRFAATVHDVGMTLIDEQVMGRAGSLTDDERDEIRRHPERGVELLGPFQTMGTVREIVLAHHEWWDGTGYPRGLRGAEIPVGARILAVVDAYESMTLGRPYRPARSRDEAVSEIQRLSRRQFDPDVVWAFGRVLAAHAVSDPANAESPATSSARR